MYLSKKKVSGKSKAAEPPDGCFLIWIFVCVCVCARAQQCVVSMCVCALVSHSLIDTHAL